MNFSLTITLSEEQKTIYSSMESGKTKREGDMEDPFLYHIFSAGINIYMQIGVHQYKCPIATEMK